MCLELCMYVVQWSFTKNPEHAYVCIHTDILYTRGHYSNSWNISKNLMTINFYWKCLGMWPPSHHACMFYAHNWSTLQAHIYMPTYLAPYSSNMYTPQHVTLYDRECKRILLVHSNMLTNIFLPASHMRNPTAYRYGRRVRMTINTEATWSCGASMYTAATSRRLRRTRVSTTLLVSFLYGFMKQWNRRRKRARRNISSCSGQWWKGRNNIVIVKERETAVYKDSINITVALHVKLH